MRLCSHTKEATSNNINIKIQCNIIVCDYLLSIEPQLPHNQCLIVYKFVSWKKNFLKSSSVINRKPNENYYLVAATFDVHLYTFSMVKQYMKARRIQFEWNVHKAFNTIIVTHSLIHGTNNKNLKRDERWLWCCAFERSHKSMTWSQEQTFSNKPICCIIFYYPNINLILILFFFFLVDFLFLFNKKRLHLKCVAQRVGK